MVTVPVDRGQERGQHGKETRPSFNNTREGPWCQAPSWGGRWIRVPGPGGALWPMEEVGRQTEKDTSASNCCNGGLKKAAVSLGFKFICFSRNYTQRETATPPPHSPLRVSVFR